MGRSRAERLLWVGSTHSLTVRPDIRGHRYANSRKVTYSRLTDAVTSTSAKAEDLPDRTCISMAGT